MMKIASILLSGAFAYALSNASDTTLAYEIERWETIFELGSLHNSDGKNATRALFSRDDQCTDPSFGTSQWASHANDGNGRYAGSCGDSGHNSNKCWTDVYAVQAQTQWSPWKVVSGGVDCAGSASCSISDINTIQTCKSQSTSVSVSIGIQSEVLNIGGEVTHETGTTDCTTHTSQKTWQW
jgi:hypothetical protein